jgi:hypothetical protein
MFRHLSTFDTGQGVDLVVPLFRHGSLTISSVTERSVPNVNGVSRAPRPPAPLLFRELPPAAPMSAGTTRHKSVDVLPGYVRRVDLFTVRTMRGAAFL